MGWYLRKSLKLGPIRFNLSKSGIGTSVGVKGLRIGSGPKGKYVHAGREGLYFRQALSGRETIGESDFAPGTEPDEDNSRAVGEPKRPAKDWLARTLKRVFLRH